MTRKVSLIDDFTVEEIKGALRRSKTHAEVNATAVHFARHVTEMAASRNKLHKTMADQIKNLAVYRRLCIGKGWG